MAVEQMEIKTMPRCVICHQLYERGRELTCSDECHEELVNLLGDSGEFAKVIRLSTGVAYKVPTEDIIEKGLREGNLDQYPLWEETKTDSNIFRQAKQLLRDKPVLEMDAEEREVIKIVTMSLLLLRHFSDIPIDDGLEELSKLVEEDVGRSEPG